MRIFANVTGSVTGFGKITGKGKSDNVKVAEKFMKGVVTILPICMVVQTALTERLAEQLAVVAKAWEDCAVFCQSIDRRCLGDWVAITSKGRFIVRDKENDIFLSSKEPKETTKTER